MAAEQALREQNQLLRKQLEDMNAQMQAIMAHLQGNKIPRSSQASQETLLDLEIANAEAVVLVETAQQKGERATDYKAPYIGNSQPERRPPPNSTPEAVIQAPSPVTFLNSRQLRKRPFTQLPPLPVSQEYVYKQLVAKGLLSPVPAQPWNPPYPAWYDPNAKCAFHNDVAGHSTENCNRLRQEIHLLINAGIIKLNSVEQEYLETKDQSGVSKVASKENMDFIQEGEDDQGAEEICWPGKQRKEIHAPSPVTVPNSSQFQKRQIFQQKAPVQRRNFPVRRFHPLPVSQGEIFKQLVAEGLLKPAPARSWVPPYPPWFDQNVKCAYHSNVMGHSTENCTTLRQKIHELIDAGNIKFNPVESETSKANDRSEINSRASGEDSNSIWPRKQREDMHVAVIRDGPTSSNIWKIPQGEEGPRSYTVTPMTFPEI
jgi:hypothetical protein